MLDEGAFFDFVREQPDDALSLLASLVGATDASLRSLAMSLAARVFIDFSAPVGVRSRGVKKRRLHVGFDGDGDLDLDSSLDHVAHQAATQQPIDLNELWATRWNTPEHSVCLLLDHSGSMHGERLVNAAVATSAVLIGESQSSVIAFSNQAIVLRDINNQRDPTTVVTDVLRLRGHGTTDVALALRAANRALSHTSTQQCVTILLSDCRSTTGDPPTSAAQSVANKGRFVILAPHNDMADAQALASSTGATCFGLNSPRDVADSVGAVLSSL